MRVYKILKISFTEEDLSWLLLFLEHLREYQVYPNSEWKESIQQEFVLTLLDAGKIQQEWCRWWVWVRWEDLGREDCRIACLAQLKKGKGWEGFSQGNMTLLSTAVLGKEREKSKGTVRKRRKEMPFFCLDSTLHNTTFYDLKQHLFFCGLSLNFSPCISMARKP